MIQRFLVVLATAALSCFAWALPLPGDAAPALSLTEITNAPEGTPKTLEELKGKVVVLEFWATWCGPCLGALPHLNEIYRAFSDRQDVVFLAITDEPPETTNKMLENREMLSAIAHDNNGQTFRAYGVRAIPRTIVLNRDGVVVGVLYPEQLTRQRLQGYIDGQMDLRRDFDVAQREEGRKSYEELSKSVTSIVSGGDPLSAVPHVIPEFQIIVRKNPYGSGLGGFSAQGLTLTKIGPRDVLARVSGLSQGQIEFPPNKPESEDEYDLVVRWPTPNPEPSLRIAAARLAAQGLGYDAAFVDASVPVLRLVRVPTSTLSLTEVPPDTRGMGTRFSPTEFAAEDGSSVSAVVSVLQHVLGRVVRDETGLDGYYRFPEITFERGSVDSVNSALRSAYGLELIEVDEEMKVFRLTPLPD